MYYVFITIIVVLLIIGVIQIIHNNIALYKRMNDEQNISIKEDDREDT